MTNTTQEQRGLSLDARFDRIPPTSRHTLWIAILGVTYFVEVFDNAVFGFLAPSIRTEFGLTIPQIGLLTSAAFVGMFLGAFLGGRLADRFGRQPLLVASCLGFSVGSLMSGISPSWELLMVSRVVTGLGVQACVGVLMVMVSEMFPSAARGRFFAILTFIGFAANPLTAFISLSIAPSGPSAWRWVFAIGAVGIVIGLLVLRYLPETVRWQVTHNRIEAATRTVASLEKVALERGRDLPEPQVLPAPPAQSSTLRDLLHGKVLKRLLVVSSAFFIYLFCLYGFITWLPTILTDRGMEQPAALQFAAIVSLATIVGPVIVYPLADKVERKTMIFSGSIITAGALVIFSLVSDPTVSVIAALVANMSALSMTVSFYTYMPEVFPTTLRGVGVGTVNAIGRIAGVLSGILVATMYTTLGFQWLYISLGGLFLLSGTIIMFFGTRTTNKSLELINDPN